MCLHITYATVIMRLPQYMDTKYPIESLRINLSSTVTQLLKQKIIVLSFHKIKEDSFSDTLWTMSALVNSEKNEDITFY